MARVYIVVFIVAVVAGTVDLAVNGEPGIVLVALVGGHPLLLVSVLGALRPFISADTEGVHVQNPVRRHNLSWEEIREVVPGYHGLEIMTREDEMVIAWAVQKSNLAGWLSRRTRADDVADFLQQAAEQGPDSFTAS